MTVQTVTASLHLSLHFILFDICFNLFSSLGSSVAHFVSNNILTQSDLLLLPVIVIGLGGNLQL